MRRFLHQPIRDTVTLDRYINEGRLEDEQLDFKSMCWTDGLEVAKDVAAFANHLGGDLILGVWDNHDRATGWNDFPATDLRNTQNRIYQWLINHLRPREFVETIEMVGIDSIRPNHVVLIISIPPSIDLMAVEDRQNDKVSLRFPIRTGRRTRSLIYEEVMARLSVSARAAYLKLIELSSDKDQIRFSNPVLVEVGNALPSLPTESGIHAQLISVRPDVMTVKMSGSSQACFGYTTVLAGGSTMQYPVDSVSVPTNHSLTIPLEFIRAVWKDSSENAILHIALSAKIVWQGGGWSLVSGGD